MEKRIPASMRTRQSLSELIEGRLASPDGRAELVRLATRLIVEEALEAECRDALGRDYYERGAEDGRGHRNGVRTGRLKTAEGLSDYAAPQFAGREEPFRSAEESPRSRDDARRGRPPPRPARDHPRAQRLQELQAPHRPRIAATMLREGRGGSLVTPHLRHGDQPYAAVQQDHLRQRRELRRPYACPCSGPGSSGACDAGQPPSPRRQTVRPARGAPRPNSGTAGAGRVAPAQALGSARRPRDTLAAHHRGRSRRGAGPMTPGLAKRSRRDYRGGRGAVQSGPCPAGRGGAASLSPGCRLPDRVNGSPGFPARAIRAAPPAGRAGAPRRTAAGPGRALGADSLRFPARW